MKVVKVLHYKAGYEVRTIEYEEGDWEAGGGPGLTMRSAFTPSGDYIGNPRTARLLVVKRGIAPEKSKPDHCVCSIGFCEKEQKWYGWSHRAIYGYGVGDEVTEGSCPSEYLPIGFKAETLEDAKQIAKAMAASVS